jgi:hypothetical protein
MLQLLLSTAGKRAEVSIFEDQTRGMCPDDRSQPNDRGQVGQDEAEHERRHQQHTLSAEPRCQTEYPLVDWADARELWRPVRAM